MRRWLCAVGCLLVWMCPRARAELSARDLRVLAQAEQAQGRPERALALIARVIARSPEEPAPWVRYGELSAPCATDVVLRRTKAQHIQAERTWRALPEQRARDEAESNVHWRRALGHLAVHLSLRGEFPRALEVVRYGSARGDLGAAPCLRQIAAQAIARERLDLAREALLLARALAPEDLALARELGLLLLARGDARGAVEQLSEALSGDPEQIELRADLAYALGSTGRAEEGHALLTRDGVRCGAQPTCALLRARLSLEGGALDRAEREARALVERTPRSLDGWLLLGEIRVRAEDVAGARRAYERALALSPGHARAREALKGLTRRSAEVAR